jgi:hypothetical protein
MESSGPSLFSRAVAVLVLAVVAFIALKLAIGFVVGLISAVFWIVVVAALAVGALWARSTLKSARRNRALKQTPEDPVQAEMRRISEQLREQGRR